MHCTLNTVLATACSLALGIAATLAPPAADASDKTRVTVVNPAGNPVNTRITNPVLPVEVSNADAIPVVVEESEGSREIFAKSVTVDMNGGAASCNDADPVVVPAGKRLVVVYLSASTSFTTPAALVDVSLLMAGASGPLVVAPAGKSAPGSGSVTYASAGESMQVYSDVNLWACARVSEPTSQDLLVNVTGYFVNKP